MIDTIALTLNKDQFMILDHGRFTPSTAPFFDNNLYYKLGYRGNQKCVQNPTKTELINGKYKPRLTVTKRATKDRGYDINLRIEFSAPKLLFGNNFDELVDGDFYELIPLLQNTLEEMSVLVHEQTLISSTTSAIHYGKNIVLDDYTTPWMYIQKLAQSNINRRFDTNKTDYRNEGLSFKLHTNGCEFILYDKLKDFLKSKQSEKRSIEKDGAIQLGLFDNKPLIKPFELLRIEARFNKQVNIRSALKKIGINHEPTLHLLFSRSIAKKILLSQLSLFDEHAKNQEAETLKKQFISLQSNAPQARPMKILGLFGLQTLINEYGVREARQLLEVYGSGKWYKINKELKDIRPKSNCEELEFLKQAVQRFDTIKIADYLNQAHIDPLFLG